MTAGKRRVVITGVGIKSSLGNTKEDVLKSLQESKPGIIYKQEYADFNLKSQVAGNIDIDINEVPKRDRRYMGVAAAYAYLAMKDAVDDSGLPPEVVSSDRTGVIASCGGSSFRDVEAVSQNMRGKRGTRGVGPFRITKIMSSSVSANLANGFKIKGLSYSISSACATSAHSIGAAMEQIQLGNADVFFAGGCEEEDWGTTCQFDAMGALSTKSNDSPSTASRAFDQARDGFVISGGGGMVCVEELEHALARGAHIYGELVGYKATSDGFDMTQPSGEGGVRAMRAAMAMANDFKEQPVEYINAHGTSTPIGDVMELKMIKEVFEDTGYQPYLSSTKSLSGHGMSSTGVHEAVYCLLMLKHNFLAGSANIENMMEEGEGMNIITERKDVKVQRVMSNSFGFGGTNAVLIFDRYEE